MPYPDRKLSSWIFHPRGSYWDGVIQSRMKSYVMELSRRIRERASAFLLLLLLLPFSLSSPLQGFVFVFASVG